MLAAMDEPAGWAWTCAVAGLLLGSLAVPIPGFPGCAVGLLGIVAYAALTDFAVVSPPALMVGVLFVVAGTVGQLVAPVGAGRALGGSAGAASGAAIGAATGSLIPLPGAAWAVAVAGALTLGLIASRRELWGWVRGVLGTASGCLLAVAADGLALLGVASVLAVSDFAQGFAQG